MKNNQTKGIRLFGRILATVMVLCMVFGMSFTSSAASVNQNVTDAKSGVVQIQVWFNDPETAQEVYLQYGSGFLINETTVLTCCHVVTGFSNDFYVRWAQTTNQELGLNRTASDIKENLELRVIVYRDVYVKAKIKQSSDQMDYAILTLEQSITGREPLALSENVNQTEDVFALGFPGDVDDLSSKHNYDTEAVTITSGKVNTIADMDFSTDSGNKFDGVNCIESSAKLAAGNSGGPLVNADGAVVGINAAGNDSRNISVSIGQVMKVLDALGISYIKVGGTIQPDPVDPTSSSTPDPEPTPAPGLTSNVEDNEDKDDEDDSSNIILIAIIAVVAVIIITLIIVLIVVLGKKKSVPAPVQQAAPPVAQPYTAPVQQRPVTQAAPVQQRPVTQAASETTVLNQGAGETTVLSGGAGETTVLSNNVYGGTLIRSSNDEHIKISAAEFTVGRERSSVDYCVGGNTNISRVHARFIVRDGATYIVDNKAANGTFVNGVKARAGQEIELKNGDKILLADEKFEFNK